MSRLSWLYNYHTSVQDSQENGAITLVETLIVLGIGVTILFVWAQSRLNQLEIENARNAGRAIATFSRAAATWLAQSPPAADGIYTVNNLQDCDDPAGRRFLSCTFGPTTTIPFVRNDTGNPVEFGDLEIAVQITPTGTLGLIDFGVFRSGDDSNNDGLPDSRPDLAAAAFQTATEQTGAGVLDFFELVFAQPDPSAVILDQTDASYDLAAVDDLARLQARVGASTAGDAPFLRIDGGNEMTGGLSFENGMQVNMDATGLVVQGLGNVAVQTDTGNLVVRGQLEAATLDVTSAEFDEINVETPDGVVGTGFERFNQAPDIIRIDGELVRLTDRVSVNKQTLKKHATAIEKNRGDISQNRSDLVHITNKVKFNSDGIETNRRLIDNNAKDILNTIDRVSAIELCTPSRASIHAANPGPTSCGNTCEGTCGTFKASSRTFTYKVRNLQSLKCDSRTVRIYDTCCFISNGNCDGLCENFLTKC